MWGVYQSSKTARAHLQTAISTSKFPKPTVTSSSCHFADVAEPGLYPRSSQRNHTPLIRSKRASKRVQMCSHCRRCMQGTHDNANQSPSFVSHVAAKICLTLMIGYFPDLGSDVWKPCFSWLVLGFKRNAPTLPSTPWHSYRARMDARPSSNSKMAITPNYRVFINLYPRNGGQSWLMEGRKKLSCLL